MKLFDNLADGKLPTMDINTGVEIKTGSLVNIGLMVFVTVCLVFLAWYTFKKVA